MTFAEPRGHDSKVVIKVVERTDEAAVLATLRRMKSDYVEMRQMGAMTLLSGSSTSFGNFHYEFNPGVLTISSQGRKIEDIKAGAIFVVEMEDAVTGNVTLVVMRGGIGKQIGLNVVEYGRLPKWD